MRRHVRTVHEQRRDHACPHCNRAFGKASNLTTHVRNTCSPEARRANTARLVQVQENITRALSLLRPGASLPAFWQCGRQQQQPQPPPMPLPLPLHWQPPPPRWQEPPHDEEWVRLHPPLNLSSCVVHCDSDDAHNIIRRTQEDPFNCEDGMRLAPHQSPEDSSSFQIQSIQ